MTSYEGSVPIAGDGGKALAVALTALSTSGFRLVHEEPRALGFVGPRLLGRRQNPLNGARRVEVAARDGRVHLHADLQGVGWLFGLLAGFLALIGVGLAVAMSLSEVPDANPLVLVLPLGIWMMLMPVMYLGTRRAIVRAFDDLLQTMADAEAKPDAGADRDLERES